MSEHRVLVWLLLVVVILWLCALFGLMHHLPTWEQRGQFGDLFGSVNALFSGFAFAGLFYTVLLQQRQLILQREELQLQRTELGLQREEMSAQRSEMVKQARAQEALARATAAQITVASAQARIEALKLRIDNGVPGLRDERIDAVEAIATALAALSDRIELGIDAEH